jgi:hypothetical protein
MISDDGRTGFASLDRYMVRILNVFEVVMSKGNTFSTEVYILIL